MASPRPHPWARHCIVAPWCREGRGEANTATPPRTPNHQAMSTNSRSPFLGAPTEATCPFTPFGSSVYRGCRYEIEPPPPLAMQEGSREKAVESPGSHTPLPNPPCCKYPPYCMPIKPTCNWEHPRLIQGCKHLKVEERYIMGGT